MINTLGNLNAPRVKYEINVTVILMCRLFIGPLNFDLSHQGCAVVLRWQWKEEDTVLG